MPKEYHTVYIVGAGPGDPELLTVKALRLLQDYADIVVYDRLIPQALLDLIPENVEKVYAGKSCKEHVMTQDAINQELVEQALLGKRVVRLKGGDPFIFGRGGEEIAHLAQHGLRFEVVPGISAAAGISALHGIPLTHRGVAHGVRFITGHQQKGEPVVQDWSGLADPMTTLVIYMGLANLEVIAEKLIAAGLPAETPVAAIQDGTTEQEKRVYAPLNTIGAEVKRAELEAPVLVIIGNVVTMATAPQAGQ